MVDVAQLVRALVCGTRGRGFESHLPPHTSRPEKLYLFYENGMISQKTLYWGVAKW